jgi:hypothetical protein
MVVLSKKSGPLYEASQFKDTKDPCPVFDGVTWHIFGSGGNVREEKWKILHAIAPLLEGPWIEADPVILEGLSGEHVAAPGVYFDHSSKCFHMFVQTDFLATNGTVEYLTSRDGKVFKRVTTALSSMPDTEEAGIYDPHPALIKGEKYLVYSGTPRVLKHDNFYISMPDIFLAHSVSNSWEGPWKRCGKILDHHSIAAHHNQHDHPEYEWGIEGPQLIELLNGSILLNATCFLPSGKFGTRQRTFFALAGKVRGPYRSLGPVIQENLHEWESGENGHAAGILEGNQLHLFYQARSKSEEDVHANNWRYGIATFDIAPLLKREQRKNIVLTISSVIWNTIQPRAIFRLLKNFIKRNTKE